MGIGESIHRSSLKVKRRLFDREIQSKGRRVKGIKLSFDEDIFHDKRFEVIEAEEIQAVIRFPDQMPLDRFRLTNSPQVAESRTYFFDLIPIEGYFRFSDHIETGDMIFFFLEDEKYNKIPYLLQAVDTFGAFDYGIVWKMHYLAPYNGKVLPEIIQYLEQFVVAKEFDEFKEEHPDSNFLMDQEDKKDYVHEGYTNLFKYPLTPRDQEITIDGSTTIQCAFGEISVVGIGTVTPNNPLRIEPDGETVLSLEVSEDCKFPAVYASEFFHPFTVDKKTAYAFQDTLTEDLQKQFILDLQFLKQELSSSIVLIDQGTTEIITLGGAYQSSDTRPIFYVEDGTGKFISISLRDNLTFLLEYSTSAGSSSHTFTAELEDFQSTLTFHFAGGEFSCAISTDVYTVEGASIFEDKTYYMGYEPERYINDFIRQVFF